MKRAIVGLLILTLCVAGIIWYTGSSGRVAFYDRPTSENNLPHISMKAELTHRQAHLLRKAIRNMQGRTDDYACNRLEHYYDGEITFSRDQNTYYFSYELKIVYYDHYFGVIDDEALALLHHVQAQLGDW
ncbi:MAG: hypothetical protein E7426_01575 [Ruminococcaceae bacterium]|jgi:hypothetical protein|nr:hypothetical protein [Oscillospiraceae bacterium]